MQARGADMRKAFSAFALLGALGCSQPVGPGVTGFSIETAKEQYQAGSDVVLRFANQGAVSIYYNDCVRDLQFLQGGSWATVFPASQVPCRDNLLVLGPQQQRSSTITLASMLLSGKYRFRFHDARDPAGGLIPTRRELPTSSPFPRSCSSLSTLLRPFPPIAVH